MPRSTYQGRCSGSRVGVDVGRRSKTPWIIVPMPTTGSSYVPAAHGPQRQPQGHRRGGRRVSPRRPPGFRKDAADAVIWIYAELAPSPSESDSCRRSKGNTEPIQQHWYPVRVAIAAFASAPSSAVGKGKSSPEAGEATTCQVSTTLVPATRNHHRVCVAAGKGKSSPEAGESTRPTALELLNTPTPATRVVTLEVPDVGLRCEGVVGSPTTLSGKRHYNGDEQARRVYAVVFKTSTSSTSSPPHATYCGIVQDESIRMNPLGYGMCILGSSFCVLQVTEMKYSLL
ncbi:hypothetical protein GUJ93_ZPchr0008g11881 [Zizania palustris]|uniref:Uncharacterized protein n=1 Tax=Zizania palustris TaxID=103762 RepID=A0A8J5RK90_ZIZPA|nr:hypothetical protein GUJ93_ZPchr0008g11881 [Zizania palustris]